ncbi:HGxxPAAW family protein [Nocardiopsis mangrovi]|uniref:HGxxPAAW family protein n=1 Tax=Nocardiopsis mangrovi TaxID=1179818 RepID=A0ABV9DRG5_9ACTN
MADEHHEEHDDHGNTVAAWFLTLSWIAVWTVAGVAIIGGADLVTWSAIALGASVVCAAVAGVMKKAGLGRRTPRPVPPTAEEWAAARAAAEPSAPEAADGAAEPAPATAG